MFDILVHASNYSTPTRGMQYAADVASALGANLTGIFVSEPIVPISPVGITPVMPQIYAVASEVINEALQAEPKFHAWAASRGVAQHRWQVATGFFSGALAAAANWHDALVLESGSSAPWNSAGMLGHVLVSCGIPCFVVPDTCTKPASFDTIVIASHGSPEAVRAAHAALPLLKRAKRILLIKGKPNDAFTPLSFRPPFTLEDHLLQHGLSFATRVLDKDDGDAGAQILGSAAEAGADLVVMGAYGRSRFSEWVLGGATRHVLEHATLPLLVRH